MKPSKRAVTTSLMEMSDPRFSREPRSFSKRKAAGMLIVLVGLQYIQRPNPSMYAPGLPVSTHTDTARKVWVVGANSSNKGLAREYLNF